DTTPLAEPVAAEADLTWMEQVDATFGKYVVANAEMIIFYDFGTRERLGVSIPFVVVWLLAGGVFLTLRMRFINLRAFRHAIDLTRGTYDTPNEPGEVTHFQALAAALSATVGLGNIAGVAIAIVTGGPGATVWIILVGILGMTTKFTECTLGQLYRVSDEDGHVLGGPMRYLRYGLKDIGLPRLGRVLAVVFAVLCIGASFGGGNSFQVGQSLEVIRDEIGILQDHPWIYGLTMALGVGIVIIGGIKSIAAVAGKIVPLMCTAYVLAALYILAANASAVPAAIGTIVSEAFSLQAGYGAFLGILVIGIKRGVFSNEAGIGSAAIAHSAAKTDEPVSEGIVALLEPFIDTVLVCTITALVVVVTGVYEAPNMQAVIASDQGARLTLEAFVVGGHEWFRYILFAAVVLFAYSTCISWSYYGERSWVQLFGVRTSIIYKLLFLGFTVLGSIITRGNILAFSDLMILGMSFPNLLGVFLLSGLVKRQLDLYWKKYQNGEFPRMK
ncbi:MAG: alanine/glycine:cation symporter family protein, partial [Novipirellula sp. JB048]